MGKKNAKRDNVWVQVVGDEKVQIRLEKKSGNFIEVTPEQMENIAGAVKTVSESFIGRLSKLKKTPSECTVEFGMNVEGTAGIPLITKGTVGANFAVSLTWDWSSS